MKYQLSIIVPGIRNENWLKLYNSIDGAFSGAWEIVFVGPYELPEELKDKNNIQYIKSFRSPIACQQQGLLSSTGIMISWCADDGICTKDSYDIAFQTLQNESYTTIITGKYQEGPRLDNSMEGEDYYKLSNHSSMILKEVPKDCLMLNCGVVSKALLMELGGWEAEKFQVCPMAYNDFAIRAYKFGSKFILQKEVMFECTHQPGTSGDHGPIHTGQIFHDEPMFKLIYSRSEGKDRIKIDINNWQKSPERWERRFGKKT